VSRDENEGEADGQDEPGREELERLRRELRAVEVERARLRSELEQIRISPLGPLIDPARTARSIVERYARRLRALLPGAPRRRRSAIRRERPHLSGLEVAWRARRRLARRPPWVSSATPASAPGEWLTPILVDCFGRDGSTAMMALLSTSPHVVIEDRYPYERRYFNYLWRWSRLLSGTEWPAALWTKDDVVSIAQEGTPPLLGPPPWFPRELLEASEGRGPLSQRCFELAWREFSSRVTEAARSGPGGGSAPRYYAEKHVNTWLVDMRELPPVRLIALLRDPRDTHASIRAFEEKEPATSFGIQDERAGVDRLDGILDRHRQRLRWIAGLLEEGTVPVIRYEELTADLPGVARRLELHLEVELAPAALQDKELVARHGSSTANGSGRWRRDLDAETAERFTRELRPELEAVGFET
jgi:hypothetical protein